MVNFRANFIRTATILKQDTDNKSQHCEASFVELMPASDKDYLSLNIVNRDWDDTQTFAHDIAEQFNNKHISGNTSKQEQFFALTTQKDKFEMLHPKDVLALALTKRQADGSTFIDFLQVSPEYNHSAFESPFHQIGSAVLDSIKKIIPVKNISLSSVNNAIHFYEKNEFEIVAQNGKFETLMRWMKLSK